MIGFEDEKGELKIRNSRNVRFNENEFYFKQKKTQKLVADIDNHSNEVSFLSQLAIDPLLPKNVDDALQNPNWFEAMKNEYDSLLENNVWSLVKSDGKPEGSRWHFALKFGPDGDICRYEARFVAKGFSQVFGKDFWETYSPTTRLSTIRILMSLAISKNYQLIQMDIKTAYLNAPIEEDVVIKQPEGFELLDEDGKPFVCKLKKSLYGLKQYGRNWFLTLKAFLITLRFVNSFHDECLFIKKQEEKIVEILCLWVDDLIICGLSENFCDWFYAEISMKFKISDYSEMTWFLGMRIERFSSEIKIRQEKT